ncbi:hypothetical protein WA026_002708 [Henosepilachna vigintioctopunctata]|uniref:SAM domain-containing protein n=1 Tax=Henosepilachna vigintioctopunctata TaxID=420089 RepID=A0AAW1TVP3_9CUCU
MDLLTSLLKGTEADQYINNFRDRNIDPFTLKLLDADDLEALGITDEMQRCTILKIIANLQIPAEKKRTTEVDSKYVKTVLYQMSNQLHKHLANLSCAVMRNDVVVCDVKLKPSVKCLKQCIKSLEIETKSMKQMVNKNNHKQRFKLIKQGLFFGLLITSSFILFKCVTK